MKATNAERINWRIQESLRAERRGHVTTFVARWQNGVETLSGYGSQKLRLEFAPSVSATFTKFNSAGATI